MENPKANGPLIVYLATTAIFLAAGIIIKLACTEMFKEIPWLVCIAVPIVGSFLFTILALCKDDCFPRHDRVRYKEIVLATNCPHPEKHKRAVQWHCSSNRCSKNGEQCVPNGEPWVVQDGVFGLDPSLTSVPKGLTPDKELAYWHGYYDILILNEDKLKKNEKAFADKLAEQIRYGKAFEAEQKKHESAVQRLQKKEERLLEDVTRQRTEIIGDLESKKKKLNDEIKSLQKDLETKERETAKEIEAIGKKVDKEKEAVCKELETLEEKKRLLHAEVNDLLSRRPPKHPNGIPKDVAEQCIQRLQEIRAALFKPDGMKDEVASGAMAAVVLFLFGSTAVKDVLDELHQLREKATLSRKKKLSESDECDFEVGVLLSYVTSFVKGV